MVSRIIPININTQLFLDNSLKENLNGFFLTYKKTTHLISLHHNLPIVSVYHKYDKQRLNISINSGWSEVLIMDTSNIDLSKYILNTNIQKKLPKVDDLLMIKTDEINYRSFVIDIEYIPFNNINNLTIPYIKAHLDQTIENMAGLSGSPVYIDDKLIGVFSKFNPKELCVYILPIYIIIKNIEKKDNENIYGLEPDKIITKIKSYNIKDNLLYHPGLKSTIPVNSWMLIEGDVDNEIINYPIKLKISNESLLIFKKNKYKITSRLLTLLKKMNVNKQILLFLLSQINGNDGELWFQFSNK